MSTPILTVSQLIKDSSILSDAAHHRFQSSGSSPPHTRLHPQLARRSSRPLWMLTRQWQFGEIQGEDAASCVTARIAYQHEEIDRLAFGKKPVSLYDPAKHPS